MQYLGNKTIISGTALLTSLRYTNMPLNVDNYYNRPRCDVLML